MARYLSWTVTPEHFAGQLRQSGKRRWVLPHMLLVQLERAVSAVVADAERVTPVAPFQMPTATPDIDFSRVKVPFAKRDRIAPYRRPLPPIRTGRRVLSLVIEAALMLLGARLSVGHPMVAQMCLPAGAPLLITTPPCIEIWAKL